LITAEWRTTENNRRARYYRITRSGLKRLETEREEWERSARAVDLILRTT
jgi:DNA-binding PadR family transcriptional regulator